MGGTGLVGRALLAALSTDLDYAGVTALGRREVKVPGVRSVVLDPAKLSADDVPGTARVAFCCLGTTLKAAGSREAFRAVDHGLVLRYAEACRARGVRAFHVVSAMGADPASRTFYNRVKGEAERDLAKVGFASTCAYRPALLLGERDEYRPAERAGIMASKLLRPLLPAKYRAIPAETVARAMARHAKHPHPGFRVHESDELWTLAGG